MKTVGDEQYILCLREDLHHLRLAYNAFSYVMVCGHGVSWYSAGNK